MLHHEFGFWNWRKLSIASSCKIELCLKDIEFCPDPEEIELCLWTKGKIFAILLVHGEDLFRSSFRVKKDR